MVVRDDPVADADAAALGKLIGASGVESSKMGAQLRYGGGAGW